MKLKKVGMRTIKTVFAVVLTLEISNLLNINSPILAGIAAIMTMETSVSETFKAGKYRMYGTIFGAIVALIVATISPIDLITTALGLFIIIYMSNMLEWEDGVTMAMIVFLAIVLEYEEGHRLIYALNRTVDTFIGVIVGTAINYFIRPPKIDMRIDSVIENMIKEVKENIYAFVWEDRKPKLDNLKKKIIYIEENYEILKKDIKFNKNIEDSLTDYEKIFNMFQNIQSHFRVIKLLDKRIYIDEENEKLLEAIFLEKIPKIGDKELEDKELEDKELEDINIEDMEDIGEEDMETGEIDIIYNYHLKKILYDLRDIEEIYIVKEEEV